MIQKEHLTDSGFLETVSYINFLNKPISKEFLDLIIKTLGPIPVLILPPVPIISNSIILNPYWIVGFIMGEGSFTYSKSTSKSNKTGAIAETKVYFSMEMSVSQLLINSYLLISIANHIGVGPVKLYNSNSVAILRIFDIKIIQHLILPYFNKYPLLGNKKIQFDLWLKAVLLIMSWRSLPKYSFEKKDKLIHFLLDLSKYQSRSKDKTFLTKFLRDNKNS